MRNFFNKIVFSIAGLLLFSNVVGYTATKFTAIRCHEGPSNITCDGHAVVRQCRNIGTADGTLETVSGQNKQGNYACAQYKDCDDKNVDCNQLVPNGQGAE